ncbi:hypothetical protein SAMN05443573_102232 [Celeribacter indicus]|nr:hypothetical protein SAMN05443573_102232 [Celeribacter indicus]
MIPTTPQFYFCRGDVPLIRRANAARSKPVADAMLDKALGGFERLPVNPAPITPQIDHMGAYERGEVFLSLALAVHYTTRFRDRDERFNWLTETPAGILSNADEHARRSVGGMCAVGALAKIKKPSISPVSKHMFEKRPYRLQDWGLVWNCSYLSNTSMLSAFLHQQYEFVKTHDRHFLFCASKASMKSVWKAEKLASGDQWGWAYPTLMPRPIQ